MAGAIADLHADNDNSVSFKIKTRGPERVRNDDTKNVKIRVPLKYRNNFRRTFKMSLII